MRAFRIHRSAPGGAAMPIWIRWLLVCSTVALLTATARADDWPQWLGPQRDSVWRETGILDKFPADGPRILWRASVGGGYSGPAVAEGRVYLTDYIRSTGTNTSDPGGRDRLTGTEPV